MTINISDGTDYPAIIKSYRQRKGLTQNELATLLGISPYTLRDWEQGISKPSFRMWRRYGGFFN